MTALQARPRRPARWWLALALTGALGIVAGWLLRPSQARTFDQINAVLSPLGYAVVGITVLLQDSKRARLVIPLLLIPLVAVCILRPHEPAFGAFGIIACVVAIMATLVERKYPAIAAVLLCCASIGISEHLAAK